MSAIKCVYVFEYDCVLCVCLMCMICLCVLLRAHVCVRIRASPNVVITITYLFMEQPLGVNGNCDGRQAYIVMHCYHLKSSYLSHICVLFLTVCHLCLENLFQ